MIDPGIAYRENAVRGASPVGQIVLLYDQVVADLRRARQAISDHDVQSRTDAINHAILIIGHLQNKLNFELGGDVARCLERFYNMMREQLQQAQATVSAQILAQQMVLLLDVRDAWQEVDRREATAATPSAQPVPTPETNLHPRSDWKA